MKYFAFFRGINVGGKNIVKMADLKQMFAESGFYEAKTYIQSGNVIFSSDEEKDSLKPKIEKAFKARFGFPSAVIVRSGEEIQNIIDSMPFETAEIERAESEAPGVEHLYVYFSAAALDREGIGKLSASYAGNDRIHVSDFEIYLLCFQSVRDSKLAVLLTKVPQPLTARNFKTLKKISAI